MTTTQPEGTGARRLHPATVLFNLAGEIRAFGLPALLVLFGTRADDDVWKLWAAVFIVPGAVAAVARYFAFTYEYRDEELRIRSGVFFRKERHIPYGRIQNIDARQTLAHGVFGVYAVSLETGSGGEADATLSVLPAAALAEMRARVFRGRAPAAEAHSAGLDPATAGPAARMLLRLDLRELAICGLVRGRGLLVLGALVALGFQFGLDELLVGELDQNVGPNRPGGRDLPSLITAALRTGAPLLLMVIAAAGLLVALRLAAMLFTMVRLHGFTLVRTGGELRMSYGLLTRVRAAIPLPRIQTVTIREGVLHRFFQRQAVRADTAGGETTQQGAPPREWLAPVIPKGNVPAFVRELLPEAALDGADWHPPHPRAFRRLLARKAFLAIGVSGLVAIAVAPRAALVVVPWLGLAWLQAKLTVRRMGFAVSDETFMFRSGWRWRHVTIAPLRRVQAVAVLESPFDRRHGTATLAVDTAGATGTPHRLIVPFVPKAAADRLAAHIAWASARGAA